MGKRLPYRKRNKEATMQRLIDAVGVILKAKGHSGIGVNKVALEAGVSKPMIYDHFKGLTNLLKAYIRKKDFWLPAFDQLKLPDPENEPELRQFYSVILQEQFKFFLKEEEMQKLILWPISEVKLWPAVSPSIIITVSKILLKNTSIPSKISALKLNIST
jgi:AcrR family transcriptional regulator